MFTRPAATGKGRVEGVPAHLVRWVGPTFRFRTRRIRDKQRRLSVRREVARDEKIPAPKV